MNPGQRGNLLPNSGREFYGVATASPNRVQIQFFGATGETTGSCHLIRANGTAVLFDCGLFQGRREQTYMRNQRMPFDPGSIGAVVQSHAHIDHSGKLPILVRDGFGGPIHATHGTRDLCEILLLDSAHIQIKDAEFINRRRVEELSRARRRRQFQRQPTIPGAAGPPRLPEADVVPLYLQEDVRETLRQFRSHGYGEWFDAAPGMRVRFHDAGHILGSAWIEAEITEGEKVARLVFTGDYGRPGQPILRDPEPLCEADVYVSESTYGNRSHPAFESMERELGDAVERLARRGRGRLLVPVFAVGRTQNILYTLSHIFARRDVGDVHVVVDSPLATAATQIVAKHTEYFDEEALAEYDRVRAGNLLGQRLSFTETVEHSKALNRDPRPLLILSASGMLESGRIVHHVAWNIGVAETEILIVGYQASHTLGRKLLDGASTVAILGDQRQVRARITPMLGFSSHADREGLLAALTPHAARARSLFLIHGENDQRAPLARELVLRGFTRVEAPEDPSVFAF